MNLTEFFESASRLQLSLTLSGRQAGNSLLLSNEALFQLPLLAMFILMMAKSTKKPRSEELGQVVGECIERTLAGFKGSSQHIGWSANLRIRTVNALAFLEMAELVHVDMNTKYVSATPKGRKVFQIAALGDGNLATTLVAAERNYHDMSREKNLRLQAL